MKVALGNSVSVFNMQGDEKVFPSAAIAHLETSIIIRVHICASNTKQKVWTAICKISIQYCN